jgi:hypothetical protein
VNGKEVVVSQGNYNGMSKGMEAYGFRVAMQTLANEGLLSMVKTITTDEDSSVKKILADDGQLAHIKVLYKTTPPTPTKGQVSHPHVLTYIGGGSDSRTRGTGARPSRRKSQLYWDRARQWQKLLPKAQDGHHAALGIAT